MTAKNVIIAQPGGPTAVINNTLRGIILSCTEDTSTFGTIYGGWHGIEGILKEELINLSGQDIKEIEPLRTTNGYGSEAKYWAHNIQKLEQENRGSSPADSVIVTQAMGRKTGFLPAAAQLADPGREFPLQIYMAESKISLPEMADNINSFLKNYGRCIVVVSEGYEAGIPGGIKDAFGHAGYGFAAINVQQLIVNYLNSVRLNARGAASEQVPATGQRHSMIHASNTDLEEAFRVGKKTVEIAYIGDKGLMATLIRQAGPAYNISYVQVPLDIVALSERNFPEKWISQNGCDVTDGFLEYARPLIGDEWASIPLVNGIQRFKNFKPVFAHIKLN